MGRLAIVEDDDGSPNSPVPCSTNETGCQVNMAGGEGNGHGESPVHAAIGDNVKRKVLGNSDESGYFEDEEQSTDRSNANSIEIIFDKKAAVSAVPINNNLPNTNVSALYNNNNNNNVKTDFPLGKGR